MEEYKYYAFISYSRKDSRAAAWLQRQLEHFRIPVRHVTSENRPHGEKFVRPVFRDRRDLEINESSFTEDVKKALAASRYLIVLASPRSASSEWVDREVRYFLETHGDDISLVVPVVLEGEPSIAEGKSTCLPISLRRPDVVARNLPSMLPDDSEPERRGWENGVVQTLSYLLKVNRENIKSSIDAERMRLMRIYAAVAAACMLVFAGLSVWAIRAERQADANRRIAEENERRAVAGERLAEEKRKLSEQTLGFVKRMLQEGRPNEHGPKSVVDLLTEQVSKIDLLSPPELRYAAASLVGQIMLEQSMNRPAERLLKDATDYYRLQRREAEFNDAANSLAVLYSMTGRSEASLALQREIGKSKAMNGGASRDLALHLHNIAIAHCNAGNATFAWEYCEKAEAADTAKKTPVSVKIQILKGQLLAGNGDFAGAVACYDKAESIQRELGVQDAALLLGRGEMHYRQEDFESARVDIERGIELEEKLHGENSATLSGLCNVLGLICSAENKPQEAIQHFERAIAMEERRNASVSRGLVTMYNNLGMQLVKVGNCSRAKATLEKAVTLCEGWYGKDSVDLYLPLINLGYLAAMKKDTQSAARTYYERAKAIIVKAHGADYYQLKTVYNNLSVLDADEGDMLSSLRDALEAQRIVRANGLEGKAAGLHCLINAALAYDGIGQHEQAMVTISNAVLLAERTLPAAHPDRQKCMITRETIFQGTTARAVAAKATAAVADIKNAAKSALDENRQDEAEKLYRQLLTLHVKGGDRFSSDYALVLNQLGVLASRRGAYGEALPRYLEAVEIEQTVTGRGSVELPVYFFNVGFCNRRLNNDHEAIRWFEKAVAAWKDAPFVNTNKLTGLYTELGHACSSGGRRADAIANFALALECDKSLHGPEHLNVAIDLENLAEEQLAAAQTESAITNLCEALRILGRQSEKYPRKVAKLNNSLANAYDRISRFDEAIRHYRMALALDLELYGETNRETAVVFGNLGDTERKAGDLTNAVRHLRKAVELKCRLPQFTEKDKALVYNDLGIALDDLGDYKGAIEAYDEAMKRDLRLFGREHREVMVVYSNLAIAYMNMGRLNEECECRRKTLDIALLLFDEGSAEVLDRYRNLADCLYRQKKFENCAKMRKKVVEILGKTTNDENMSMAKAYNLYAGALYEMEDYVNARINYDNAVRVYRNGGKEYLESVAIVLASLGYANMMLGNYDEAIRAFEEADQIVKQNGFDVAEGSDLALAGEKKVQCEKLKQETPIVMISSVEKGGVADVLGIKVGDVWLSIGEWRASDIQKTRRDVFWKNAVSEWKSLTQTNRVLFVARKVNGSWKKIGVEFRTANGDFNYRLDSMSKDEFSNLMSCSSRKGRE